MSIYLPKVDVELGDPARNVVAWTISDAAKRLNKKAPGWVDLTNAVTGVVPYSDVKGASTLTVTMSDPRWNLLASGIFSPSNRYGRLDPMDMNWPKGSRYWWRLNQVSPKGSTREIQLIFFDRVVHMAMNTFGHLKANRAGTTRAEFLWWVFKHVPHAYFFSERLKTRQQIDSSAAQPVSSSQTASGNKTVGVGANYSGLTVMGRPMSRAQAAVANKLLMTAHNAHANEVATTALIYAGIWESRLNEQADNGRYWGVLQASHSNFSKTDTVGMATSFLHGGRGFQGGGAITLSRHTNNPVEIAVRVEMPSFWPSNAYARESGYPGDNAAVAEARKIVREGGGAAGSADTSSGPGTTTTTEPYNFEWGPADHRNESAWDCGVRLAQEVNWELFSDGNVIYFDADTTLIKQKPAAVIRLGDPRLVDWYYDWESRQIATQMTLLLVMEPFGLRAGEVIKLENFGPASDSSTAGLPGRWLIANIARNPGDLYSTLTLTQPTPPKLEPAPVTTTTASGGGGGGNLTGIVHSSSGFVFPMPKHAAASPGRWSQDQGVDIAAAGHTPLLAVGNGAMVKHGIGGFGPWAPVIRLNSGGYVYYGHAGPGNWVKDGTAVRAGQVISEVGAGKVGMSTGPHLEIGYSDVNGTPVPGTSGRMLANLRAAYG